MEESAGVFRPVRTSTRLRAWPSFTLSHNSLCPKLVVRPAGIEVKVIRTVRLGFEAIERVEVRPEPSVFAVQTTFVVRPRRGLFLYAASFGSAHDAALVTAALRGAGVLLVES